MNERTEREKIESDSRGGGENVCACVRAREKKNSKRPSVLSRSFIVMRFEEAIREPPPSQSELGVIVRDSHPTPIFFLNSPLCL